ncbi:hypothetical protein Ahy_A05g023569 isoform C [Arachis hypogaea]|uniref:glucose-1-phosphate adenylyltransferase n=1 Tax=Arachis hypogaea TaxID=3818 RepID=A0A445D3S9_ARAHY|nr:hypothetical protein Ahy_A05g023569 isoform C [Arachis hypogaea]
MPLVLLFLRRLEALRVRFRRGFGQSRGFDINLVNKSTFSLSSTSLNRHIARAYNSGTGVTFGDGYVEDPRSKDIEDVLILSGDHLYRMDYMDFVQNYRESGADITLSCLPMDDR